MTSRADRGGAGESARGARRRLISDDVLHAPAEIGPGRGKVARLEDELDVVEEPPVEPPVDPGHLGDLVVGPVGGEDLLDDPEQVALKVLGERGDGQARDDVVDLVDPAVGRGSSARSRTSPSITSKLGAVVKPLAEQPGEVGVALEDDDAGSRDGPARRGPG